MKKVFEVKQIEIDENVVKSFNGKSVNFAYASSNDETPYMLVRTDNNETYVVGTKTDKPCSFTDFVSMCASDENVNLNAYCDETLELLNVVEKSCLNDLNDGYDYFAAMIDGYTLYDTKFEIQVTMWCETFIITVPFNNEKCTMTDYITKKVICKFDYIENDIIEVIQNYARFRHMCFSANYEIV